MSKGSNKTNRLITQKSPYLLQHAYNPVDWYPWSPEAFDKAKQEDKPIFLSIGYSTCHWCHVMERESFEDEEVAAYLNKYYISIKVDREERPDVDHIYMTVCQAMTGHGGWPLTILMTPDKKPFYAGTYFPKGSKWGRPGLMDILGQIHDLWNNDRQKVNSTSDQVTEAIKSGLRPTNEGQVSAETLTEAYQQFTKAFDHTYGGFGEEPKFPTAHHYLFLLREWQKTGDHEALKMVESSLKAMHKGGMYDHLGYGFARYSVDKKWLVPHFEKMLYDNALLAYAYIETFQATKKPYYARIADEIFKYVEHQMTAAEGGFYSAEDADSEGEEGKFYVWTPAQIIERLGEEQGELFCEVYDVTEEGNFEVTSILNLIDRDLDALAERYGLSRQELEQKMEEARQILFNQREKRIHPHMDDKILTSWNGLMIAALAKGAAALQDPHYLDMAKKAAQMVETHLVDDQGRLLARYRDGESDILGYLDDYAFYIWGLHELYFASGEIAYLERSDQLIKDTLFLFWDKEEQGFFFYGVDGEELLTRPKEIYDGALPSGNSVMTLNLVRHSRLTGKSEYDGYVEKLIEAFAGSVSQYPMGHSFFLVALQMVMGSSTEIVVTEGQNKDTYAEMVQHVQQAYLPFAVFLYKGIKQRQAIDELAPIHQDKEDVDGQTALYICENFACQQPLQTIQELKEKIDR